MRLLSQQWPKIARGAAKNYLKINRNVFAFLYHSENLNHPISQGKSLSTFKIQPPKPSSISNPSLFCLGCLFCDLHSRLETNVRFIKRKSPGLIQRPIQCKKMPGTFLIHDNFIAWGCSKDEIITICCKSPRLNKYLITR